MNKRKKIKYCVVPDNIYKKKGREIQVETLKQSLCYSSAGALKTYVI
jgi:hypothetical protein